MTNEPTRRQHRIDAVRAALNTADGDSLAAAIVDAAAIAPAAVAAIGHGAATTREA